MPFERIRRLRVQVKVTGGGHTSDATTPLASLWCTLSQFQTRKWCTSEFAREWNVLVLNVFHAMGRNQCLVDELSVATSVPYVVVVPQYLPSAAAVLP